MIRFGCPRCRRQQVADDTEAGGVVVCVGCGQSVTLPVVGDPLPALPPERDDEPVSVRVGAPLNLTDAYACLFAVVVGIGILMFCVATGYK